MTAEDWHGTPGGAMRHWRAGEPCCDACLKVKRRAAKGATLDRVRGNPRMVALGDAAHGIIESTPRDQLARATGLTVHKLCRLNAGGPDQNVYRRTRDRILEAGAVQFWTPIGVQRRLHALHAIGWSMRALSAEIGTTDAGTLLNLVRRENPQFVRRDFADRIIDAYDRLRDTPRLGRGSARAKNLAAEKRWAAPNAWENIDDPLEDPFADTTDDYVDEVVVLRLMAGDRVPSSRAEKVEAMVRWVASGRSKTALCEMHGWNSSRFDVADQRQDGAA